MGIKVALGPWSNPPNFIAAAAAGASAGLQARGQDIAQMEAGDRLSLAYQQLASEERQRSALAKQRLDAAQQMMQYRRDQLTMLDQYRQERLAQSQAAAAEKVKTEAAPKLYHVGGGLYRITPGQTSAETVVAAPTVTPRPSAFDTKDYADVRKQMDELSKQIDSGTIPTVDLPRMRQRLNDLNSVAESIKVKAAQGVSPSTATIPKVTSKDQHAALPKGTTYIGTDGKTYRKKDRSEPDHTEDSDAQ